MSKVRLGDVCTEIFAGGDVPRDRFSEVKTEEYSVPIYANAEKDNGLYGYTDNARVFDECVTVAARGTIGFTAIRKEPFLPVVRLITVIPKQDIITLDYLYYALKNCKPKSSGTSIPQLTVPDIKSYIINLVSIDEQQKIVERLDKISDLIALRKQQLSKLDELIKARFVELFGEWKSDPEPLKSFLEDITYGFTNPMPDAEEGPWKVTAKDVVNGKVNYDTARKTTVEAFEELTAKSKPAVGDVLLTKDGTLGRCAVVEEGGICVNQSVAVLKCNNKILPKFLAILLQMPEYQREMLKNAGGGTIKHIYITKVVDMLIMVPTISQQLEFLSFVEQTDKSKLAIQKSLDELETLKKSLMQEYFG